MGSERELKERRQQEKAEKNAGNYENTELSTDGKLLVSENPLEEENRLIRSSLTKIEEERAMLREMFHRASEELNNIKKPSLLVAEVSGVLTPEKALIRLPNGNKFCSYVAKSIASLQSGDTVLVDQKSLNILEKVELRESSDVERFVVLRRPEETWSAIGGLRKEIQEIQEVIELPLKNPELFRKVGISPPKGVLLYGPPGTGKTLLAKAVANSTNATFIEVVGSELVQKFIGEGAKLVGEIFELARKRAPSIVFIDEIDALAATRMDTGTSGEREVNRTFMQLLSELDGFRPLDNVKVIGATNRAEILDHALLRPGRLDRLIEIGLPDQEGRLEIFKVHTAEMNPRGVRLQELARETDGFSGADIRSLCTEAGYFAIRQRREQITRQDFLSALEKIRAGEETDDAGNFFG